MKKIITAIIAAALAVALASCTGTKTDEKKIVVGASATPHAEILEQVKDNLEEEGYTLEIKVFDDYILPNKALTDGELDANYFQHISYLTSYNASNGTDIASAALIHYEPFGLYANGVESVADAKSGATIIIPADDSNETRALLLLAQENLIVLPEDASALEGVTVLDIVDNKGFNVVPVQAEMVPAQLKNSDEGTLAVVNGNYALQAGLKIEDAIAKESAEGDAAQTYGNIIATRNGEETSAKITALVNALKTEEVAKYITESYNGAVVALD